MSARRLLETSDPKRTRRVRGARGDRVARRDRRDGANPTDASSGDVPLVPGQKLYYRIGEVSKLTGVKPYVLRYWESEFRWMAPQKSRSKQRLYRRKDIEMILLIRQLLHGQRYTIAGARKHLRELGIGRALEEAAEESKREASSSSPCSARHTA